jgi:hypothetical protein
MTNLNGTTAVDTGAGPQTLETNRAYIDFMPFAA